MKVSGHAPKKRGLFPEIIHLGPSLDLASIKQNYCAHLEVLIKLYSSRAHLLLRTTELVFESLRKR